MQELQACKGQERIEAEDKCRLVCRRNRNGKGGAINDDSYWKAACLVSFYWLTSYMSCSPELFYVQNCFLNHQILKEQLHASLRYSKLAAACQI